jgi:hypothetical protein
MINPYKEKFIVSGNGMHQLSYEDLSCRIELPADDVREISVWVSIGRIISKNGNNIYKLTKKQKLEMYKRVSAIMRLNGYDGIYTDEFKQIEEDIENIDHTENILDIEG